MGMPPPRPAARFARPMSRSSVRGGPLTARSPKYSCATAAVETTELPSVSGSCGRTRTARAVPSSAAVGKTGRASPRPHETGGRAAGSGSAPPMRPTPPAAGPCRVPRQDPAGNGDGRDGLERLDRQRQPVEAAREQVVGTGEAEDEGRVHAVDRDQPQREGQEGAEIPEGAPRPAGETGG